MIERYKGRTEVLIVQKKDLIEEELRRMQLLARTLLLKLCEQRFLPKS
jgi:hypothetical protein